MSYIFLRKKLMARNGTPLRVLLVKPPAALATIRGLERFQRLEPLELSYLAGAVPAQHSVRGLDLRLYRKPWKAFQRELKAFQPHLVGITAFSHEYRHALQLAICSKAVLPGVTVVVGGHHATASPESFNAPEAVDWVVRGEGCGPFGQLVEALAEGERPDPSPGLIPTGEEFARWAQHPAPPFPSARQLPRPRHDLWDLSHYRIVWTHENPRAFAPLWRRVAMVRSSFGCRMHCTFCPVPTLFSGKHWPRDPEDVAEEIATLPVDCVYFSDDENFLDRQFSLALVQALAKKGVRKRYFAWVRSTTVLKNPEVLEAFREVGLDCVFVGFEFTSDAELRAVKKGATVSHNLRAHEFLRRLGVAVHGAFMALPSFSHEDFDRLEAYLKEMPPAETSFTVCCPSPGTCDWDRQRPFFWVQDPFVVYDCMHPLTPTTLPLSEFARRFARLHDVASPRHPLRQVRVPLHPGHVLRVEWAHRRYTASLRHMPSNLAKAGWLPAAAAQPSGRPNLPVLGS
ncbi:MAG: cobalamin-dependent protein [Thermoanaerobaculum sp.]|nr:cobalamin-dependent protein [Thermoanaerobaculum sp.]